MFRNLLRPDSPLMITMTQLTDCIFLSLFFLLGCMPVVTAGAAFAALYDASYRAFREGERHSWQRFWTVYRRNWKQSILPTLVFLAVFWVLAQALIGLWNACVYGQVSWMVFSGTVLCAMLVPGGLSLLFPMLSRFENSTPVLLKNTLVLAMGNMPRTLALGIGNVLALFVCLRWIYPLFFLPALAALMGSYLIEPIFRPFMGQRL